MPPRKKTGRAAAEAAYADLMREHTTLVGNVGAAWDDYLSAMTAATEARERYEQARSAAVKAGALTADQFDQMGYPRTPKLSAPPGTETPAGAAARSNRQAQARSNGTAPGPSPIATKKKISDDLAD